MPSLTIPPFPIQDGVRFAHIDEFPGRAVSDDGNVWTCRLQGRPKVYADSWRKLRTYLASGYPVFCIGNSVRCVHCVVLETFIGPRPDGFHACHNNGVRNDARLCNLRWDTPVNNMADKVKHGTVWRGGNKRIYFDRPVTVQVRLPKRELRQLDRLVLRIERKHGIKTNRTAVLRLLIRQELERIKGR